MNELEDRIRAATRAAGDTVRPAASRRCVCLLSW